MKITIKTTVVQEQELDVELPAYRMTDDCVEGDSWDTYVRLGANGTVLSITERHNRGSDVPEWRVELDQRSTSNYGYYLTRSEYRKLDAKDFERKLAEFQNSVAAANGLSDAVII